MCEQGSPIARMCCRLMRRRAAMDRAADEWMMVQCEIARRSPQAPLRRIRYPRPMRMPDIDLQNARSRVRARNMLGTHLSQARSKPVVPVLAHLTARLSGGPGFVGNSWMGHGQLCSSNFWPPGWTKATRKPGRSAAWPMETLMGCPTEFVPTKPEPDGARTHSSVGEPPLLSNCR
jgi:hypothetical protein